MLETIRWVATGTGIAGALLVALNLGPRVTGAGFVVFTLSSVGWVTAGLGDGTTSLVVQNAVLFLINLLGIYRWLILKREERDNVFVAAEPVPLRPGVNAVLPDPVVQDANGASRSGRAVPRKETGSPEPQTQ